jgi:Thymidylate synthase
MEISGFTLPELYTNSIHMFRHAARPEESRNGPVMSIPAPVVLTLVDPRARVLYDPVRKANPFFHVMEFVWMMAGSNDVRWLEQFNSRYRSYAEPNTDVVWGSYGDRWRNHFMHEAIGGSVDQIKEVAAQLKADPETRRAVLGMWDPGFDLQKRNDLPCNTHIYFRILDNRLHMTVCNRSNDLIWGALGANVVHMTMLQELIAIEIGVELGHYRVMTNNLHMYPAMPGYSEIMETHHSPDQWQARAPLMIMPGEGLEYFLADAEMFLTKPDIRELDCVWFQEVALPIYNAYMARRAGYKGLDLIKEIQSDDWRVACELWVGWKNEA